MTRISLVASIYIVLSIAVERYLAVCKPHLFREIQSWTNRFLIYILPVLLFSFIINIPRWLDIENVTHCLNYSKCFESPFMFCNYFMPTDLRKNEHYVMYYNSWFWVIVTVIAPFSILSTLSC